MYDFQAGKVEVFNVDREASFGFFLQDQDYDGDGILLHYSEVVGDVRVGDDVEVFLFHDKQGRLTATMKIPAIVQGTYGWVEVVDVHPDLGVFVSIGISKDVLISADDLPRFVELWPAKGDQLYITLETDKNGRMYGKLATENIIKEIATNAEGKLYNQKLKGRVYRLLRVGTYVLSEEGYRCFVHETQRTKEPRLGELVEGRVVDVKPDGSINLSFLPFKQEKMGGDAEKIYEYMATRGGAMPYWDKTQADIIQEIFGLSKGAFKRALGKLMKDGRVYQEDGWTYYSERK
ncbi:S1-like domain-containing RNA-binding protein [Bacillus spongiae]|uniref:S1-like domain-containing RNA-binding protein n=1 Tax=Bacillus spongiae TaxID=2683610 RepID=A0ABU8HH81_9BACI